ncbi:GtrA family protein [Solibacillus sp. FSL K6-1523]|uniref:GtrA family protein n=1 Tax=Solibacillus sp. FSL K6-1523 TaxID=2921471 RepID=UPI004046B650
MKNIFQIFDKEFLRFLIVGVINTIVGTSIMFIAYNLFSLSYWVSTILNYTLASILSYFLNKYFTFKKKGSVKSIVIFSVNIIICYLIAYVPTKFVVSYLLTGYSINTIDNVAMIIGMILFTLINFLGQKFIVFK